MYVIDECSEGSGSTMLRRYVTNFCNPRGGCAEGDIVVTMVAVQGSHIGGENATRQ